MWVNECDVKGGARLLSGRATLCVEAKASRRGAVAAEEAQTQGNASPGHNFPLALAAAGASRGPQICWVSFQIGQSWRIVSEL